MTETLKPCPLAEALELTQVHFSSEENADALRAELAKRGYAITRAPDDVAQIAAWLLEQAPCQKARKCPKCADRRELAAAVANYDWKDKDDG